MELPKTVKVDMYTSNVRKLKRLNFVYQLPSNIKSSSSLKVQLFILSI